jgi:GTP pyrophosphokinase
LKDFGDANLTLAQREALLEEIGRGGKFATEVVKKIYPYEKILPEGMSAVKSAESALFSKKKMKVSSTLPLEQQVVVGGQTGFPTKIAACCKPEIGQPIMGYVNSRGKRISIHKLNCPVVDTLNREKIIFAEWKGHEVVPSNSGFRVGIKLEVFSRVGLIQDIAAVMSKMKINILDIMIKRGNDKLHYDYFLLDMSDFEQFDELLNHLEDIEGVLKVVRADEVFKNNGL